MVCETLFATALLSFLAAVEAARRADRRGVKQRRWNAYVSTLIADRRERDDPGKGPPPEETHSSKETHSSDA